jgi:hypothetical protein
MSTSLTGAKVMETFMPRVSPAFATANPGKHVNYTLGMVLGVDDFTQEFAYLSGRDQWLARDLIGYGTVSGLKVRIEKGSDKGPRVVIEPGVALSPRGQMIRVTPAQCAYLNPWLAANKENAHISSPPSDELRLYVVLCYRDCATEMTPVPGEPCRSDDELMAASRLADDFRLELRFDAPDQQEEDALRDFVGWLSQIEITDTGATTLDDFVVAVREAAHLPSPLTSPLGSPHSSPLSPPEADFMFGSPLHSLSIPAARTREYLRAAFRVWVTELRPLWRPNWFSEWQCCDQKSPDKERPKEECLLLAELDVPLHRVALSDETKVDDLVDIVVNEERRPFLIHSRLLQEWLLCGRASRDTQTSTGVVVFKTTGSGRFVARSNFIDPGLGKGPISVQLAFVTAPDEFVFGDVPNLQRILGAEVKVGADTSTFRIIANTFETPFDSEFSVRWFASRPGVDRVETEVVILEPLPEEPDL